MFQEPRSKWFLKTSASSTTHLLLESSTTSLITKTLSSFTMLRSQSPLTRMQSKSPTASFKINVSTSIQKTSIQARYLILYIGRETRQQNHHAQKTQTWGRAQSPLPENRQFRQAKCWQRKTPQTKGLDGSASWRRKTYLKSKTSCTCRLRTQEEIKSRRNLIRDWWLRWSGGLRPTILKPATNTNWLNETGWDFSIKEVARWVARGS